MTQILLLATALLLPATALDMFQVRSEIQGLYDEISQATLQFVTASDVDEFHAVIYTPDWVSTDAKGHTSDWVAARQQAIDALSAPSPDSITQRIRKVSPEADGVTTVVAMVTTHTIVDRDGRYGPSDMTHTLTETTLFRDRWVRVADEWKLKSRTQLSEPTVSVDKPDTPAWSL